MKTRNDIPKAIQKDLIDIAKAVLQTHAQWDTHLRLHPGEPYLTLKQFQTLLRYCSRNKPRQKLLEYLRYPVITADHPLFPLFRIQDQAWYVVLPATRGGHTGQTFAVPVRYLRIPVQGMVHRTNLSQPYEPSAQLAIKHFARQSWHKHHNNHELLRETVRTRFPQFSRQTIWRAIKSFSRSPMFEGGRP